MIKKENTMITKKDLIVPTAEFGFRKPKIVKVDVRKTIFDEIKADMDDFFTEMDKAIGRTPEKNDEPTTELVHEVDGKTVCEPLEDVLKREMEHLEMKAELAVGI